MNMKLGFVAVLSALTLFSAAANADETYRVTLPDASKIGKNELRSGDYKVAVDASKVKFTEVKTGQSVEFPAKVENAATKFSSTEIHSNRVDGVSVITEIRLGGSKVKLGFE